MSLHPPSLENAELFATLLDERTVDQARSKVPRKGPRLPKAVAFLEIFAGCGALSGAMSEYGFRVAPPFDVKDSDLFDVTRREVADVVVGWIRRKLLWCVWLAPPCTSWTLAKGSAPSPSVRRRGLKCAEFSVRVAEACFAAGVPFVIENPKSSRLWDWSRLQRVLLRTRAVEVDFDMCAYGTSYKKPTRLCGTLLGLESLSASCSCTESHSRLQGLVQNPRGGSRRAHLENGVGQSLPSEALQIRSDVGSEICPVRVLSSPSRDIRS